MTPSFTIVHIWGGCVVVMDIPDVVGPIREFVQNEEDAAGLIAALYLSYVLRRVHHNG